MPGNVLCALRGSVCRKGPVSLTQRHGEHSASSECPAMCSVLSAAPCAARDPSLSHRDTENTAHLRNARQCALCSPRLRVPQGSRLSHTETRRTRGIFGMPGNVLCALRGSVCHKGPVSLTQCRPGDGSNDPEIRWHFCTRQMRSAGTQGRQGAKEAFSFCAHGQISFLRKGCFLFAFLRVSATLRCFLRYDAGESVTLILNYAPPRKKKRRFETGAFALHLRRETQAMPTSSSSILVVTDLGRSMGCPRARAHT